ncbi:MAG: NADH-quinone oxidoreductase subunit J [Acidobacteriota bacterium]
MTLLFYIFAGIVVFSAVMVISRRNAVHSALWLVLTFFAVAGLFILQKAEFIAAVQVLVYAGGIMVLFLFVIMLVNIERVEGFVRPRKVATAVMLTTLMVGVVASVFARSSGAPETAMAGGGLPGIAVPAGGAWGNLEAIGMVLLTDYLLAFELVSVVLTVAVIGVIVLCRRAT